jgi:hypothetical protein
MAKIDFPVVNIAAPIDRGFGVLFVRVRVDPVHYRQTFDDSPRSLQNGNAALVKRGALIDHVVIVLLQTIDVSLEVDQAIDKIAVVARDKVSRFSLRKQLLSSLAFKLSESERHYIPKLG